MTDRSKQVQDIRPISTYAVGDDLIILQDVSANQTTIITVANFFGNSQANIVLSSNTTHISTLNLLVTDFSTPVSSSDTVRKGKIWTDANYIYVAVANNVIKRANLNSF